MSNKIVTFFLILISLSASAQFNSLKSKRLKTLRPIEKTPVQQDTVSLEEPKPDTVKQPIQYLSLPLKTITITDEYGKRQHPVTGKYHKHNGIDLRAKYDTVYSMLPGVITKQGENKKNGKYIKVKSNDFECIYTHLSEIFTKKKQKINAGDKIAISGNTGRTTGPHLHLSVKYKRKYVNPKTIINYITNIKTLQGAARM